MYRDEDVRGNFVHQKSAVLVPGATATLITEADFGRAVFASVTGIANYSNDDGSWGEVEFRILVDGIPHTEFGSFYDAVGSVEKVRRIARDFIRAGSKVEVVAYHSNSSGLGNTYKIGFILEGEYVANR